MLVFIDLDGTLTAITPPGWRPYRDGQYPVDVNSVPVLLGAKEFIQECFQRGIHLVLVSDSHPRYVEPIRSMFGLEGISLADKPNTQKLDDYIAISHILQQELCHPYNCFEANRRILEEGLNGLAVFIGKRTTKSINVKEVIPITGKEDHGRFLKAMEAKMEMPEDESLFGNN